MQPDQLFFQSATLIYFSGWLWWAFSLNLIPLRPFIRRPFQLMIGVILLATAAVWSYLFLSVLIETGANPFRLPLTVELLLTLITAVTYVPLSPWRNRPSSGGTAPANIPGLVKTARLELIGLLVGLPIASLFVIAPFGTDLLGWLPSLLDANPGLCGLIAALAVGAVAVSQPTPSRYALLRSIGIMAVALAATYIMMITALVATI